MDVTDLTVRLWAIKQEREVRLAWIGDMRQALAEGADADIARFYEESLGAFEAEIVLLNAEIAEAAQELAAAKRSEGS